MTPYEQAKEFHDTFHPVEHTKPTAFLPQEALYRAGFKVEELVEFLYGAANNDLELFDQLVEELKASADVAAQKVKAKESRVEDPLVEQVDALLDTLYFTYGSFALMKVDPTLLFSIVHQANMGKVFPDGQAHYHPITGKVMKPENWQRDFAPEGKLRKALEAQTENSDE